MISCNNLIKKREKNRDREREDVGEYNVIVGRVMRANAHLNEAGFLTKSLTSGLKATGFREKPALSHLRPVCTCSLGGEDVGLEDHRRVAREPPSLVEN